MTPNATISLAARVYDGLLGLVCIGAGVALLGAAISPELKHRNRPEVETDGTDGTEPIDGSRA